nr:hypothetical protein [Tanacetum cinerariifolium]
MSGGLCRVTPGDDIGATPSGISRNIVEATPSGVPEDNVETPLTTVTPSARESNKGPDGLTGKEIVDADLKRPFKEAVKTSSTQRIIKFADLDFKMPANIKLYDKTTDPEDHLNRFSSATNSEEWPMPVWCQLAKRYSDKVPKTVDEMMTILDDFLRLEEAFASTELPKGDVSEAFKKSTGPMEDQFHRGGKRKSVERDKSWMKAPIVFPPLSMEDASDEPLIIEAAMEGSTQMDLVGFAGSVVKPLGKFELEVVFGDGGLFRRVMINFTVVRPPSPYNVILGRTGLRTLRAVSSTIHSMVKFPTPRGFSTLVKRTIIISECRRQEKKQMIERETRRNTLLDEEGPERVDLTEQTLVNPSYPDQLIGRNLKTYVDDMVIKSNDEKVLIADIADTFDNLHRINMKLNPKKCSFGVEEGKFLKYMVTSEGIQANLKRTKAIADTKSPQTLMEMQCLSGKLAALKRKEEMMYVYLATAKEAVSAVLLTKRKGKQCPIHYVSRTLNETEKNYAPLEKLALLLLYMSRRLRRYFEAHHIKVITDQPLKRILNKARALGKLAKYLVELETYNITYVPRNAIKGQVLADFLLEAIVGNLPEEFFRLPARVKNKDNDERWTLFINEASNSKGSGVGLVLISPGSTEFTYALRLNFTSTNNEVKYKAFLAGLHMAAKMKVQDIDVMVDSKLVASQINRSYVASSPRMVKYLATTSEYIAGFKSFTIQNIPRTLNQKAVILSKLATHVFYHLMKEVLVEVLAERSADQKEVGPIVEEEEDN